MKTFLIYFTICIFMILLIFYHRMLFSLIKKKWYIKHLGRAGLSYYEVNGLKIRKCFIDGEILMGIPGFVICVPNDENWEKTQPKWASKRKDEIINRIKTELTEPKYSYQYEN